MKQSLKKLFIIPLAVAVLASCGGTVDNSSTPSEQPNPGTSQTESKPGSSETPAPSTSETPAPASSEATSSKEETSTGSSTSETPDIPASSDDTTPDVPSSSSEPTPEVIHVTSVSLDKKMNSVHIGDEFTLVATVLPVNADDKSVTWESSDTEVATVVNGKVTALKVGTANITVKTVDGEKTDVCAVTVEPDAFTFAIQTEDGEKTSVTKDINYDDNDTDTVTLAITKNGSAYRGAEVETTFEGDEEVIESATQSTTYDGQIDVAFSGKVGFVTMNMKLKGVLEAPTLSVTYNVTEYFLNQTIRRASISEADGKITFSGGFGNQYTGVVKKADTKWVLKATMDIPEYAANYASVGVGSFIDAGDQAAWFSIRNTDNTADNKSEVYLRDFFKGWGAPTQDAAQYDAYKSVAFQENDINTDMVIDMTLIRDGLTYYYDIGGYHGTYVSSYAEATYAGFFSQEQAATITNYSIAYGDEAIVEAKGTTYDVDTAKLDAASFVNANTAEIVRGESRTFTAAVAPTYSKEGYHLVADAAYAENVTIDGMKITVKESASAGEMTLHIVSDSEKDLGSIVLPVVEVSSDRDNDQLVAKGGVILNEDGSFVFPESKSDVDGVVDENKYTDNVGYTVNLKQKVVSTDFSIEFDVENYKATQNYPKLMFSLGGAYSQFYLTLGRENGTVDRFETFTPSKQWDKPQWNNTVDFKTVNPSFDRTAKHHYKIESKNGFYNFYCDDMENALAQKQDNDDRNIIVPLMSYYKELPVRIATRGVSAKVSNLQVTSGTVPTDKLISSSDKVTISDDNSITATFPTFGGDVWSNSRFGAERVRFISSLFPQQKDSYKMSFDAEFSDLMADGKLILTIGDNEYHICNSTNDGNVIQKATTSGQWKDKTTGLKLTGDHPCAHFVLTNDGQGNVTLTAPGNDGDLVITTSDIDKNQNIISFYLFNSTAADGGKTVTIKNVVVEDFATEA